MPTAMEYDRFHVEARAVFREKDAEIERLRAALQFVIENTGFGQTQEAVRAAKEALKPNLKD